MSSNSTFIVYVIFVLFLSIVGYYVERSTRSKISSLLISKTKKSVDTVCITRGGEEKELPQAEILEGDFIILKARKSIPADGIIIDGSAFIDESMFTGKSISLEKGVGERVIQDSRVIAGNIKYQVTSIPRKEEVVRDRKKKDVCNMVLDVITGHYLWFALGVTVIALCIWFVIDRIQGNITIVYITNILIGYPCLMYLAFAVTHSLAVKKGTEFGVLLKEIDYVSCKGIDWVKQSKAVIFDKTGTITEGRIVVKDVHPLVRISEDRLLQIAASLEIKANHLVKKAILDLAERKQIELLELDDIKITMGFGIRGNMGASEVLIGNNIYLRKNGFVEKEAMEIAHEYEIDGKNPIFIVIDHQIAGLISVADTVREECAKVVECLKKMEYQVIMVTGDEMSIANMVANEVGIEEVFVENSALEKENRVKSIMEEHNITIMVGNGRNDVGALIVSGIGIAMPYCEEQVMNSANIILMDQELESVIYAIQLCCIMYSVEKQNLIWIGVYHIVGVFPFVGLILGGQGMSVSCVINWIILGVSLFVIGIGSIRLMCFKTRWKKKQEQSSSCTKTDK